MAMAMREDWASEERTVAEPRVCVDDKFVGSGTRIKFVDFDRRLVDAMRAIRDSEAIGPDAFQFDGHGWLIKAKRSRIVPLLLMRFPYLRDGVLGQEHVAATTSRTVALRRPLYGFQTDAVNRIADLDGNCILALPIGTGKTTVAIAYGETLAGPKLVVVPKSVQQQWADEILILTGKVAHVVCGKKPQRRALFLAAANFDWTIITYEQARELKTDLPTIPFALLVADEAQYLKNPLAQRTKAVLGELHRRTVAENKARATDDRRQWLWVGGVQSPKHLMLSGTPMLSRPIELYPLLHSVGPKEWYNATEYKDTYCGKQVFNVNDERYHVGGANDAFRLRPGQDWPKRQVTTFNGASNVEELHGKLRGYYHRVKLADALPDMPELTKVDTKVELNATARKDYDTILSDFPRWLAAQGKSEEEIARTMRAQALAKIGELRQCTIADKVEQIAEALDTILEGWGIAMPAGAEQCAPRARSAEEAEGRESVLVFSTFREPLAALKRRYGPLCTLITGGENSAQREEAKRAFQSGEVPILLLTHGAGGVGLNLQRARIVFLLNEEWTPSANEQAIGRAHRNGQKNGVVAYTMLAHETVDEAIHEALALKAEVIAQVLDGGSAEDARVTSVLAHVLKRLRAAARKRAT